MQQSNLKAQWETFCELPFPSECAGEQIEGIDLVSLDTFAAGCVERCVDAPQRFDPDCNRILTNSLYELEVVVANTEGEAFAYFEQLRTLIRSILEKH